MGMMVTTVGYQSIPPHSIYPVRQQHPLTYSFNPEKGRILTEYQLVYISEGCGFFESQSFKRKKIKAGTMILLFPGEVAYLFSSGKWLVRVLGGF